MIKKLLFLSLNLFVFIGFAQISNGGQPISNANKNLQTIIPTKVLPFQDASSYIKEDVERDKYKDYIWRFGINVPVDIDVKQSAVTDNVEGGTLYRYRIYSEGAISINFRFSEYKLPKGASLFIYNDDKTEVLGSFTSANNKETGVLGVTLLFADAITLEYFEPNNAEFEADLKIDQVTHGYRSAYMYNPEKGFGSSGDCNNDVVCPVSAGWDDQINSVAMLVTGSSGFCSGAIINNSAFDGTPYLLTANHCYSDPTDWIFWFNWHKTTCETNSSDGTASSHDDVSGATLVARNADSDFCLVQLSSAPPTSYNVFYAGWDKRDIPSTSSCGIHHPSGDVKKISFDNDPSSSSDYLGSGLADSHWQISAWDDGTTEGGSSGSPLFNQNHKIIGQLHGGYASCTNIAEDVYGKLAMSWEQGITPQTRLRDWLAPCGYDLDTLQGYYPTALALDAQIKSINSPLEYYCSEVDINPSITIKNLGTDNLSSCSISYTIDGGSPVSQNWTGNLATGETEIVSFSSISISSGNHTIVFNLTSPNGGTDEMPNSNICQITYNVSVETGDALPYTVDFEDTTFPPTNITLENPDGATTWERNTNATGNGTSTAAASINCLDYSSTGAEDIFITPKLDFSSIPDAELTFNIAYRRYNGSYYEQFIVYISDDCGSTWDVVYDKSSTALATGADQTSAFTPTTASDWRMDTVDLTAYVGGVVTVKFVNVNGYGNYVYLDDINITSSVINDIEALNNTSVNLYPNPANNFIFIDGIDIKNTSIDIVDVTGKNIKIGITNTNSIDISNLEKGVYFVVISNDNEKIIKKFIKE